jgi:hypothetical protein
MFAQLGQRHPRQMLAPGGNYYPVGIIILTNLLARDWITPDYRLRAGVCTMDSAGDAVGAASAKRVFFQSLRATAKASIPSLDHQPASFRARWSSRWWSRHSGTVNSSLTLPRTP